MRGMDEKTDKPTRRRWPWVAMLLLAIAGIYAGGYFALSDRDPTAWGFDVRVADYQWMVAVYEPLRAIEAAVRGKEVILSKLNNSACPSL